MEELLSAFTDRQGSCLPKPLGYQYQAEHHPDTLEQELKVLPVHSCGPEQNHQLAPYASALAIIPAPFPSLPS